MKYIRIPKQFFHEQYIYAYSYLKDYEKIEVSSYEICISADEIEKFTKYKSWKHLNYLLKEKFIYIGFKKNSFDFLYCICKKDSALLFILSPDELEWKYETLNFDFKQAKHFLYDLSSETHSKYIFKYGKGIFFANSKSNSSYALKECFDMSDEKIIEIYNKGLKHDMHTAKNIADVKNVLLIPCPIISNSPILFELEENKIILRRLTATFVSENLIRFSNQVSTLDTFTFKSNIISEFISEN